MAGTNLKSFFFFSPSSSSSISLKEKEKRDVGVPASKHMQAGLQLINFN